MRQLHPRTIEIIANNPEHPAYPISHCWNEVFKWLKSRQKHPKVFITDEYDLGVYLGFVHDMGKLKEGCNLDFNKILGAPQQTQAGCASYKDALLDDEAIKRLSNYFDVSYLFSNACSLYYKGVNIFPDLFGDDWKKYCPVISHKEIVRQCEKTLERGK